MTSDEPPRGSLMSLLNGNQSKPKLKRKEEDTVQEYKQQQLETKMFAKRKPTNIHSLLKKPIPEEAPDDTTSNLESMIFANSKRISARDLLKPKPVLVQGIQGVQDFRVVQDAPDVQDLQDVQYLQDLQDVPEIIEIIDTEEPKVINESKMFNQAKRTTVKDLFKQFKPKYEVSLKLNPQRLRALDKPIIIEDIPSKIVTLKVNPEVLKRIRRERNSNSVLNSMMLFARQTKSTKFPKLTKLDLPLLTKDQFHIIQEEPAATRRISLEPRDRRNITLEGQFLYTQDNKTNKPNTYHVISPHKNRAQLALTTLPNLMTNPRLNSLYQEYLAPDVTPSHDILWVDFFKPKQMNHLLMHQANISQISTWISNSFIEDSCNLLILQGSQGSGKSTAIYTAMNEISGYVHEINSGMPRGRRDIYTTLKQLCTTHLVTRDSQQGIILLEDVNILFDQDKTFWQVVYDIVQISKRPIALTCEELWNIPKSLLKLAEIVFIDDYVIQKQDVTEYLWLCCLIHGFNVEFSILDTMVEDNFNGVNYDLRQCLMDCEILCKLESTGEIIDIKQVSHEQSVEITDIQTMAKMLDISSCADIISSNSISQINHTYQPNQFTDIYYIDDSIKLTQPTLNFELNIGNYLQNSTHSNKTFPHDKYTINDLRYECNQFIASRSISYRKRTLRSGYIETTGISETSCLHNIPPKSFVLDLLPMIRIWQSFQNCIDDVEANALENGNASVKEFLNYRDFQYKSTLNATMTGLDLLE